jgi:hypothetical protein
MGARMEPGTYLAAWRAVGRCSAPPHPRPNAITRGIPIDLPSAANVIYVACIEQTVRSDMSGRARAESGSGLGNTCGSVLVPVGKMYG